MTPSRAGATPPPSPTPEPDRPWKTLRLWERFGPRHLLRKLSISVLGPRDPKPRKSDANNYPLH
jgi:hypothetical protein